MSGADRKAVVITRPSLADELRKKFNTLEQAAFFVESRGGDIQECLCEAEIYSDAVSESLSQIKAVARVQHIDRKQTPNFLFGDDDIVVVIGQDGLVANTLKYLNGQPLIAVNPDPALYEGKLLPFKTEDLTRVIRDVLKGRCPRKEITMAIAELNDGQSLLAVNDFFIGRKSHVSARYSISIGGREETQSSSGVIVSTGLGSSGWLKSVLAGAAGVAGFAFEQKGQKERKGQKNGHPFAIDMPGWDSDYLYYSVREPFPSKTTGAGLVFGKIEGEPLVVASQMPENGVIFSDGVEEDFLVFDSGAEVKISVAAKKGYLVV